MFKIGRYTVHATAIPDAASAVLVLLLLLLPPLPIMLPASTTPLRMRSPPPLSAHLASKLLLLLTLTAVTLVLLFRLLLQAENCKHVALPLSAGLIKQRLVQRNTKTTKHEHMTIYSAETLPKNERN